MAGLTQEQREELVPVLTDAIRESLKQRTGLWWGSVLNKWDGRDVDHPKIRTKDVRVVMSAANAILLGLDQGEGIPIDWFLIEVNG